MKNINIITLVDKKHGGDNDNARICSKKFQAKLLDSNVDNVSFEFNIDEKNIESLIDLISSFEKQNFIFAAGAHNIEIIKILKENKAIKDKIHTSWSSHQVVDNIEGLIGVSDIIALPTYLLSDADRVSYSNSNGKLVQTYGVAHSKTLTQVKEEFEKRKNELGIVSDNNKYDIVILGGDAPDKNGDIHIFNQDDAINLAKFIIINKDKDKKLLITNCSRTNAEVNKDFVSTLQKSGLKEDVDYKFFDFKQYKLLNVLLGSVAQDIDNIAYASGDSASILSILCDLLPNQFYVCQNGAMSLSHNAQRDFIGKIGIGKVFNNFEPLILESKNNQDSYEKVKYIPASDMIAKAALDDFIKMKKKLINLL